MPASKFTFTQMAFREPGELVRHTGGCHCGAIQFEVMASTHLHIFECNCSICFKKGQLHFIVPASKFTLTQGADNLTTYTFNTHTAKHTFCKTCGVQSFYIPCSNLDGYGISSQCLDPGTVQGKTIEHFDGINWEESIADNEAVFQLSKEA